MSFELPTDSLDRRAGLLAWFAVHRRELPWRANRDAYRVWISEAMLQQTRVEAALGHFERFISALPTLTDLAAASEDEVLALWSGLGYYSRARKLRAAAQVIASDHDGEFPRELDAALALPGVGPYTAGAVLSIAYGAPVPLVDGNVERVLCRWFGWDGNPKQGATKRALWDAAARMLDGLGDAGAWNQALMEFGALVCTPRSPRCDDCSLAAGCVALASDRVALLPELPERRKPVLVELEIALCRKPGAWLLERRPSGGRMAGLYEFPTRELLDGGSEGRLYPPAFASGELRAGESVGTLRHSITHHKIEARAVTAAAGPLDSDGPLRWVPDRELESLGLTGMTRKLLRAAFVDALR